MEYLRKILGLNRPWDGRDRRTSLRGNCALQITVVVGEREHLGIVLDANPRAVRLQIREINHLKPGQMVQLVCTGSHAVDAVRGKVGWVSRRTGVTFAAVVFRDSMANLLSSWVKPLLRATLSQVHQKRTFVRANCLLSADIGGQSQPMTGTVLDLSARGGLLETTQVLLPDAGFDLHLKFAEESTMKVRAQVRRHQMIEDRHHYGLYFAIDESTRRVLLAKIRELIQQE
jgi:hypothetical protein